MRSDEKHSDETQVAIDIWRREKNRPGGIQDPDIIAMIRDGCQAGQRARWVSVEDELPEKGRAVLVWVGGTTLAEVAIRTCTADGEDVWLFVHGGHWSIGMFPLFQYIPPPED